MKSTLLEKCSENKEATWDQMRAILNCLSYLYGLMTGNESSSWEEVRKVWDSLQYPQTQRLQTSRSASDSQWEDKHLLSYHCLPVLQTLNSTRTRLRVESPRTLRRSVPCDERS